MTRNLTGLALVLSVLVLVAGCGRGPKLVPVTGTVTMDGQPFPDAVVTFTYTDHPRPAGARTDANGAFKLAYNNRVGAPIGAVKVMIRKQGKLPEGERMGEIVPRRYNAATTLQYEVTSKGENVFTIPLTSEMDEADLQQGAPQQAIEQSDDAELDEGGAKPNRQNQPQRGNQQKPADDDDLDEGDGE